MDNAFLGPLLSAFGRSFLSKRNRGKSTGKKNIHRMGFLLVAAWGFFIASIVALIIFIVDFSRGWLNSGGIIAFIAAELVIIFSCLLFYAWYRNAYVEITRSYVLRRTFLRFVEKVEYRRIRDFGYYERTDRDNNFEDGLYIDGPYNDEGYFDEGIELHSNWVNMSYVLGQLAFRIVNERWAEPESDEDQNLIQEYVSSGRAREICLEQSGFVFPENDNSPYREGKE
ncbi:hypothetical protein B8W87_07950 [Rothia dentocariosa]|uniref:Uncharacterized protein n=1 Tax=Rothia dentocariosa TaxID=2047 RepID=A0AAE5NI62_9MICC|nr:hypothetical protein [Rothia dentocariosa]PAK85322.1 hypothetical protein B8W87_07950 [Rothia dentocariosa]